MKTTNLLLMVIFIAINCSAQKLEKLWTSSSSFQTPESVLYDPEMGIFYVSNIGTDRDVKSSDGFISMMDSEGEIENLKWLTGLNDPKGMAVKGYRLYVADINQLVVINTEQASPLAKYQIVNAKFLNDVAISKSGIVFVSDSHDQNIYALIEGVFSLWLSDPRLVNVNGLWSENGKLYAGNSSIWEIDIETKEMKELVTGTGAVDGLEKIEDGKFVFSNWIGQIFVSVGTEVIKLLDTTESKINTADLDYLPDSKTILVPTFSGNTIDCYKLNFE